MERLKNYFKRFWNEEDGMEFLQVVVIIVIVAGLAALIWAAVVAPMRANIEKAGQDIENIYQEAGGGEAGGDI